MWIHTPILLTHAACPIEACIVGVYMYVCRYVYIYIKQIYIYTYVYMYIVETAN